MYQIVDLNFQGEAGIIASYVLRGPRGVALIETGPASTYPALKAGLARLGIEIAEVTEVLVTHIHLDHAGAAGWVARESGATVYVHQVGAPHLVDPRRLLASAARIYGDAMGPLWGETLPVPAEQVVALRDGDVIVAAGHRVTAVDTPGHAYHHMAFVLDGLCFTGDVAAVRLPSSRHIRVPTPPPEVDLPLWRRSLDRLAALRLDQLLLTHFGPAERSPEDHLATVRQNLEMAADFVAQRRRAGMAVEEIVEAFRAWVAEQARADGASPELVDHFEIITPSPMLVAGLLRHLSQG